MNAATPRSPPPVPPRRPWFKFSLRTMFVLVTLVSCWLAWESSVVRHRKAVLARHQSNGAISFTTAKAWEERFPGGSTLLGRAAKVSLVRQWLGDEAIQEIWCSSWYSAEFTKVNLDEVKRAFPEAEWRESHPEPCHPGCFSRGTLVETPAGPRPIEGIRQI
ncbi:MAG: Hint domain-containing protein [Planctomycetaceae bacterium]|nr:Hint domain-containing protein [Planctomycetaceae bacterium]